jgi:hypothetical protein
MALGNGPIAELAMRIQTPGPNRAIVLERQAMARAGGKDLDPAQVLYLRRRVAFHGSPIAQPAILVQTPGRSERWVGVGMAENNHWKGYGQNGYFSEQYPSHA